MKNSKHAYYLIRIQYLGFRYHGWQNQPGLKTVQGMIDKTIRLYLGHDQFKTLGSGRTDAMVSSLDGAFELFIKKENVEIDAAEIYQALYLNLPPDINILSVKRVDSAFEIISDAKQKEYIYFFTFGERFHPFCAPYMTRFKESLNISLMQEGAQAFIGSHSFHNYCHRPGPDKNFNRMIDDCSIVENQMYKANFFPKESYLFKIKGSGFMRFQVRMMVGALIDLGAGRINLAQLKESITEDSEQYHPLVAPSSGLMLNEIEFN